MVKQKKQQQRMNDNNFNSLEIQTVVDAFVVFVLLQFACNRHPLPVLAKVRFCIQMPLTASSPISAY